MLLFFVNERTDDFADQIRGDVRGVERDIEMFAKINIFVKGAFNKIPPGFVRFPYDVIRMPTITPAKGLIKKKGRRLATMAAAMAVPDPLNFRIRA